MRGGWCDLYGKPRVPLVTNHQPRTKTKTEPEFLLPYRAAASMRTSLMMASRRAPPVRFLLIFVIVAHDVRPSELHGELSRLICMEPRRAPPSWVDMQLPALPQETRHLLSVLLSWRWVVVWRWRITTTSTTLRATRWGGLRAARPPPATAASCLRSPPMTTTTTTSTRSWR